MTQDLKQKNNYFKKNRDEKIILDNLIWKNVLDEEVYNVLRNQNTEAPFTGKYLNNKEIGIYYCAACGNALFASDGKFDSQCGWPSFFKTIQKSSVIYKPDNSHGMNRTEIICGKCDSHLGHVFNDGPKPTGLRYCLNSLALKFEKNNK